MGPLGEHITGGVGGRLSEDLGMMRDLCKTAVTPVRWQWSYCSDSAVLRLKALICKSALIQMMAWHRIGAKPLSEPMMTQFTGAIWHDKATLKLTHWGWVMHICFRKLTIISSDTGLLLGQRQATTDLNQWWNIVNSNLRKKLQWNLKPNSYIFIHENAFESVDWEMAAILSWPQCVNCSVCFVNSWPTW